jgi:replicative DNA helicase
LDAAVTGSKAERNLLGAIILDPNQYRLIRELVTGLDFDNPNMGAVFSGIGDMIAKGQPVDAITVMNQWPVWGIRGVNSTEVFEWADADVYTKAAREYAHSVRDAAVRRGLQSIVSLVMNGVTDSGSSPLDIASMALTQLEALQAGASSGELVAKPLSEILAGSDTYDWIIPDLLERQDRLILTGAEGAGKTTWVRQMAVLASAGIHPTTFQPIKPVRVLVIDAENTERQWRRAVRWTAARAAEIGATDPATTMHIQAGKRIDITRGSHLGEIHRLVDIHKPDVLFIGPLYKLVPRAITNDDDAAPLIVALDSLRERGLALIMEAHAGKASGADGERNLAPRGSAALMGWPEFGLGLRHTEDPQVVEVVRWRGDRDERSWPNRMYRGGDWPWTPTRE